MTPDQLAALQARAYRHMTAWRAQDFAEILPLSTTLLVADPRAFCLGCVVLDEAEILVLATDPARQRSGLATDILRRFEAQAQQRGATICHLEVAADNAPARAFYTARGYAPTGLRKGYYRRPDGGQTDAVLMARALTPG